MVINISAIFSVLIVSYIYYGTSLAAEPLFRKDNCAMCHADKGDFLTAKQKQECHSCHTDVPASSTNKPVLIKLDYAHEKTLIALNEKTADMQYPAYSKTSRLGSQPNTMVNISAGVFIMGSDNRLPDESPQHKVKLSDFFIDRYEVTNLQYKEFIAKTKRKSPTHFRNRTFPKGKSDHPVTYVSWFDAKAYCEWAGKRLPTEQEWEKAARGKDGYMFPWGNEFQTQYANTPLRWQELKQSGDTTPVGAFKLGRSPYGLYDMSGNVWEWVESSYHPHPGNKTPSENYGDRYKILKGGSWWDCSFYKCGISAPTFNRSFFAPNVKNNSFGFRCAKSYSKPGK